MNMKGNKYILTLDEWGCKQRRNKIKGTAQEKLISKTFELLGKEVSIPKDINKMIELMREQNPFVFRIKRDFKIVDDSGQANEYSRVFDESSDSEPYFFNFGDISDNVNHSVFIKGDVLKEAKNFRDVSEFTGWYVCDHCGQAIPSWKKQTKKCRKCRSGWFRKQYKNKKIAVINRRKERDWFRLYQSPNGNDNKKRMLDVLLKEGIVDKISDISERRILDFWKFDGTGLIVYESKNKEISNLNFSDVSSLLYYLRLIMMSNLGYKKATLIFNGICSENVEKYIERLNKTKSFRISPKSIRDWMHNFYSWTGKSCEKILVKNEGGRYVYDVVFSDGWFEPIHILYTNGTTNLPKTDMALN